MSNDPAEVVHASPRLSLWRAWLPAVVWLVLIAVESTDLLSARHTGSVLHRLWSMLFGPIDPDLFDILHAALRKLGHVIGYATLSALLFRAWRATIAISKPALWNIRWAAPAFFMSVVVAYLDEWHQGLIPSRTGTVRDVFLDTAAALVAQMLILAWLRNRRLTLVSA
ncbi:MAG TPA: VanZ family protein [Terriglobales bacterium]|nr:VanZ family protein [Terriglobales bacterium]